MEYIRITVRANDKVSLAVRKGAVVLVNDDVNDESQIWVKETRFLKDRVNTFALINLATGQAIKAAGVRNPLQLADHFDPKKMDELLLWNMNDAAIRLATDYGLNFNAFTPGEIPVKDGTVVGLWGRSGASASNQRWDFWPRPPNMTLVRLVTEFDTGSCLSTWHNLPVLTGINPNDEYQQWYMVKKGTDSSIFVNFTSNQALMNTIKETPLLLCEDYTPYDTEGMKWSIGAVEDGSSAIRIAGFDTTNKFNWTAVDVDGRIEGTVVVLSNWVGNNKQKWNIVPICEHSFLN